MSKIKTVFVKIECPWCKARQEIGIFDIRCVSNIKRWKQILYYEKCFYCGKKFCYKDGKSIKRGW